MYIAKGSLHHPYSLMHKEKGVLHIVATYQSNH